MSAGKLTATKVASKSLAAGKHTDGAGLALLVKPTGAKSWIVRVTIDGRQRDFGLGGYPAVSLRDARVKAAALRDSVRAGGDPAAERSSNVPTFEELAKAVHAQKLPTFRSSKAASEWFKRLERHALPTLGGLPVHRITRDDVLSVLDPIWTAKHHTARKVRDGIAQVMRAAMARGHIDLNPAGEVIDGALVRQPTGQNFEALPWAEVPAAMAEFGDHDGSDIVRLLLAFTVLTASRPSEARQARWAEIDSEAAVWTVPADRMKSGREHRVPLSPQALEVLEAARGCAWASSPYVFPSPVDPRRPLSHSTAGRLLSRLGIASKVHGFRSAFKTWALEATATPWAVSEAALAHRVGDAVSARYVRGDLFEQRQALMNDWAKFCAMPASLEVPDTAEVLTRT